MKESTVLGKKVEYPQHYAPEVLVAIPRQTNRKKYNIDDSKLPFLGVDTWHAYEVSFLTENGLPAVGILKMTYGANTPNIVESKSLKLYLNSFNMERYGATATEGYGILTDIITEDISKCIDGELEVCIFAPTENPVPSAMADYQLLEEMPFANNLKITHYAEAPEVLRTDDKQGYMAVMTHLLRSNCPVTHQPDWGTAYIYMNGKQLPTEESLLEYLVSIRGENHFHEEICEMIFIRLWELFKPEELMVTCIYTRRGGIDICPSRSNRIELLPMGLTSAPLLTAKLLRQ